MTASAAVSGAELLARATPGEWFFEELRTQKGYADGLGYIRTDDDPFEIAHHGDTNRSQEENCANGELMALAKAHAAENIRLRAALEWALDQAGADHPHYPYRNGDGWSFPYLVSGHELGGGVGTARFATALAAVEAATLAKDH